MVLRNCAPLHNCVQHQFPLFTVSALSHQRGNYSTIRLLAGLFLLTKLDSPPPFICKEYANIEFVCLCFKDRGDHDWRPMPEGPKER